MDPLSTVPGAETQAATPEELAALFEATKMERLSLDDNLVPTLSRWPSVGMEHLPHLRIAWAMMAKSKPELLELAKSLLEGDDDDPGLEMFEVVMGRLDATSKYFAALAQLAESAFGRLTLAAASVLVSERRAAGGQQ